LIDSKIGLSLFLSQRLKEAAERSVMQSG